MQTHAVPHEIMSVEFKLFGNFLSLREFIYIAIGVAFAYLFYFLMNSGVVPGVIAFPAIIFFGLGGAMVGLLPIQEKSLDQWIVNYFAAIRRPTQRVWRKQGYLQQTDSGDPISDRDQIVIKNHLVTPPTQPSIATSTDTTSQTTSKTDVQTITAEQKEQSDLARIDQTLGQIEIKATHPAAQSAAVQHKVTTTTAMPKTNTSTVPSVVSVPIAATQAAATKTAPSQPPSSAQTASMKAAAVKSQSTSSAKSKAPTSKTPKAPPQPVPPKKEGPKPQKPEAQDNVVSINDDNISDYATKITSLENNENTINVVVKDANELILPGVVCVIKNAHGDPVRAAISNVLGQILNNVPLKSGTYRISLTKQGYVFPEIVRSLDGEVYPPIQIKSL